MNWVLGFAPKFGLNSLLHQFLILGHSAVPCPSFTLVFSRFLEVHFFFIICWTDSPGIFVFLDWGLLLCPLLFQCDDSMNSFGVNVSVNINSHQLLQRFMCANIHRKCRPGVANAATQSSFEQNHEEGCGRCLYLALVYLNICSENGTLQKQTSLLMKLRICMC